jgi:hypothetical protein
MAAELMGKVCPQRKRGPQVVTEFVVEQPREADRCG